MDIGDLRYDRTVTPAFSNHFTTGGLADSLVDYARGKYPIDFQYRKNPKTSAQWATLYVGLTAVLNVYDKGAAGLTLTAHSTYRIKKLGWADEWLVPAPVDEWTARWPAVETYLERVIPQVVTNGRYVKTEGIVQASVSGYLGDPTRVILDREVAPSFRDTNTKNTIHSQYNDPLVDVVASLGSVPGTKPTSFGMECDALALDAGGRLVAIEIKPGSVGSLAWVAAQATMYARVLQHWVNKDSDYWSTVIKQSYEQRKALGLVPPDFVLPELTGAVIPAVAFQRVASPAYVKRMYAVQDALVAAGVGDPELVFYAVAPSGRLDKHERSSS